MAAPPGSCSTRGHTIITFHPFPSRTPRHLSQSCHKRRALWPVVHPHTATRWVPSKRPLGPRNGRIYSRLPVNPVRFRREPSNGRQLTIPWSPGGRFAPGFLDIGKSFVEMWEDAKAHWEEYGCKSYPTYSVLNNAHIGARSWQDSHNVPT